VLELCSIGDKTRKLYYICCIIDSLCTDDE